MQSKTIEEIDGAKEKENLKKLEAVFFVSGRFLNMQELVSFTDLNPVRLLEARHHGCETVSLDEGLSRCHIIVTATGVEGVLSEEHLCQARPGAILFNAGHSNREIDIDWLNRQPHQRMKAHIERFDVGETHLFC